jgi:hypothetical protein
MSVVLDNAVAINTRVVGFFAHCPGYLPVFYDFGLRFWQSVAYLDAFLQPCDITAHKETALPI